MPEVVTVSTKPRVPWNRGRIVGPKLPLKPKHIWALRTRLQLANRTGTLSGGGGDGPEAIVLVRNLHPFRCCMSWAKEACGQGHC